MFASSNKIATLCLAITALSSDVYAEQEAAQTFGHHGVGLYGYPGGYYGHGVGVGLGGVGVGVGGVGVGLGGVGVGLGSVGVGVNGYNGYNGYNNVGVYNGYNGGAVGNAGAAGGAGANAGARCWRHRECECERQGECRRGVAVPQAALRVSCVGQPSVYSQFESLKINAPSYSVFAPPTSCGVVRSQLPFEPRAP
ncbi:hypothetical protein PF005_g10571 [Phytophthora fragariae]|uniref:Uncharacterized protein n=1 Tax=Phytophthora fragariae TaxID=53985 RepID=A0A6A3KWP3_9STRA|nr:hypothetical protein PF003_g2978 [Phytophthora fragariae]KAE8938337.1 hypothetical protein PF009_g11773 [Phytophthora fragariae]KAE9011340.1 hypothetical protein PF011_g9417 [Phytophthora fragariae]KAE9113690.1 hypothetical protein PF010_g9993 [Phytophthora fragariae]KAE9129872.1 hypothetical protein PF007_g4716 [Phytophthora fragariae]